MFCRMCGNKMNNNELVCTVCGTKARVERRTEQLVQAAQPQAVKKEEPVEEMKQPTLFSKMFNKQAEAPKKESPKPEELPKKKDTEKAVVKKETKPLDKKSSLPKEEFKAYGVKAIDDRRKKYLERRQKLDEELETKKTEPKQEEAVEPTVEPETTPNAISPDLFADITKQNEDEIEELLSDKPKDEIAEAIDTSNVKEIDLSDLNLEDIDLSKLEEVAGVSKHKEVEVDKSIGCKSCGSVRGNLVYCPNCGKQFCSDCSLKVKKEKNTLIYQCRFCKKDVIIEK